MACPRLEERRSGARRVRSVDERRVARRNDLQMGGEAIRKCIRRTWRTGGYKPIECCTESELNESQPSTTPAPSPPRTPFGRLTDGGER